MQEIGKYGHYSGRRTITIFVMDPSKLNEAIEFNQPLSLNEEEESDLEAISLSDAQRAAYNALTDQEKEVLDLYFEKGLTQLQIARKSGLSQGAVHARLASARKRIKILMSLPALYWEWEIRKGEVRSKLEAILMKPSRIEIFLKLVETWNQTKAARQCECSQGLVNQVLAEVIDRCKDNDINVIACTVKKHPYILRFFNNCKPGHEPDLTEPEDRQAPREFWWYSGGSFTGLSDEIA